MNSQRYSLLDLTELAIFKVFRLLPIEFVSNIGAFLARLECWRSLWLGSAWTRLVCENITRLTGETDPKILRRRLLSNTENTGRLRAEYAVLERLLDGDRIAFEGVENITTAKKPIIFISAHLANWEVIAPAMVLQRIRMSALYDPPKERGRREITTSARATFARMRHGQELVSAAEAPMRHCMQILSSGRNLLIYVDEEREGLVWGPHLGRTLPDRGNRFFVARLALRFGASIIPVKISRVSGVKFVCQYMPALPMPSTGDKETNTKILADTISEHIDAWVRNDLDEWFWLPYLHLDRKFPKK